MAVSCWFSVATQARDPLSYFIRGKAWTSRCSFNFTGAMNIIMLPKPRAQKMHAKCSNRNRYYTQSKTKMTNTDPTLSPAHMVWGLKLFLIIFQCKIHFICQQVWRLSRYTCWLNRHELQIWTLTILSPLLSDEYIVKLKSKLSWSNWNCNWSLKNILTSNKVRCLCLTEATFQDQNPKAHYIKMLRP